MISIKQYLYLLSIISFCFEAHGTSISGNLANVKLDPSRNPYIVEQELIVPAGKKVVVPAGCHFVFRQFTGLTVEGSLVAEGNPEHQIVFTSVNDGEFNTASEALPSPFEWNGITVGREAGRISFKNCIVQYSVFGIRSNTKKLTVENSLFKQNGQYHFTINGEIQPAKEKEPFTYSPEAVHTATTRSTAVHGSATAITEKSVVIRNALGIGTGVMALAGGGGALAFGLTARSASQEYDSKMAIAKATTDPSIKANEIRNADLSYKRYEQLRMAAIITGICAGILVPVDILIWLWQPEKSNHAFSFSVDPSTNAFSMTIQY